MMDDGVNTFVQWLWLLAVPRHRCIHTEAAAAAAPARATCVVHEWETGDVHILETRAVEKTDSSLRQQKSECI